MEKHGLGEEVISLSPPYPPSALNFKIGSLLSSDLCIRETCVLVLTYCYLPVPLDWRVICYTRNASVSGRGSVLSVPLEMMNREDVKRILLYFTLFQKYSLRHRQCFVISRDLCLGNGK